jgi:hypothetical protein
VLEAVFVLLEPSSPSRKNFFGSHSLRPSLVRRIGPSQSRRRTAATRHPPHVPLRGVVGSNTAIVFVVKDGV